MYAIYGNIYHQYTPFMLAYIAAPWILWEKLDKKKKQQEQLASIPPGPGTSPAPGWDGVWPNAAAHAAPVTGKKLAAGWPGFC